MNRRAMLVLLAGLVALVGLAAAGYAGTGFTTDGITEWPRMYPHYGDEILQRRPRVVTNGDSFLATWYEEFHYSQSVIGTACYAARFSPDGDPLDPEGIVVVPDTYSYNSNQEPALCAVGDDFWVFYGYYGLSEYIYAKVVTPTGAVGEPIYIGRGTGMETILTKASAYMSGANVIAVWQNPDGIDYSLLSSAGDVLIDSAPLLADGYVSEHLAVAASDPADPATAKFLVVYYRDHMADEWLGAVRVDADGNVLDDPPIVVAEYGSYVRHGVFDVMPYTLDGQDGWLVVYDRGWTWGRLCARFVADDGAVSEELFCIENPSPKRGTLATIGAREVPSGLELNWAAYDVTQVGPGGEGIVQYGTVYQLDEHFQVICQDVVPEPFAGAELCLARNDAGMEVGIWKRGLNWGAAGFSTFRQTRLLGGAYAPGATILLSPASLSFFAAEGAANPGDQTFSIAPCSTCGGLNWSAFSDVGWLTVDPTSGAASEETVVTVSVDIAGLTPGTYYGTIVVEDPDVNNSPQHLAVTLVVTPPPIPLPFCDDFSGDLGWTGYVSGEWERGPALAGGEDPDYDHTPTDDNYLLGFYIGGPYSAWMQERSITSPALDCSQNSQVVISFWRWLQVSSPVWSHAYLRVTTDGSHWDEVWSNDTSISDDEWLHCEYDISHLAAGQPVVFVRFVMGPTKYPSDNGGWNIDDLCVLQTWFEDDDPTIVYSPEWTRYDHPALSDGHLTASGYSGAAATFALEAFYGTRLRWHLAEGPMAGKANVYFDDAYVATLDLYHPWRRLTTIESPNLPPGEHTVAIEVSGGKNPSSTNYFVDIDAFEVVP